jgi:CBS domain-containing protein
VNPQRTIAGDLRASHNGSSAAAFSEVGMPHRKIRDVVAGRKAHATPSQTTVADAARLMKKHVVGALLIVDDNHLVGIFTERDVVLRVIAADKDPKTTRVAAAMTKKPRTIDPDRPIGHALHMMFEGGFRHVPVVDNGRPIGMVSARDALGPELAQFQVELIDREHIGEIL